MGDNITFKILKKHLVEGELKAGKEVGIRIDQTLTQDATGTMAYLQFESIGIDRVQTELSVSYVDHNMLQDDFKNADDHRYLQSVAARYGLWFSRPGNGICHQVHRERFGKPGATLLGSDSHTPTSGGLGSIAMGGGGLDIAIAMAGAPFFLKTPSVLGVKLTGKLQDWVAGKDIILEVLRCLTCGGGSGKVVEYYGPGVESLPISDRFTVTNMGAELGATTSIFPSDNLTKAYLKSQGREKDWTELKPDADAKYDRITIKLHEKNQARNIAALKERAQGLKIGAADKDGNVECSFDGLEIDLTKLEPLLAAPHFPDNVYKVTELDKDGPVTIEVRDTKGAVSKTFPKGIPVQQVTVGSCTNSSFHDLTVVAETLKGKVVHPNLSMTVTPGSMQVYETIAKSGALSDLISSGCRILESACGPCIGMGQAPPSGAVSVRSFNRNFEGRSGTMDALVFLASPETCVAAAVFGKITDPRKLGKYKRTPDVAKFEANDRMLIPPVAEAVAHTVEIIRGPNIKPLPNFTPIKDTLKGVIGLKAGDNISTDHIMPAGAKVLPLRSNIPAISEFTFARLDEKFPARASKLRDEGKDLLIVGGVNYGQGSSREHAALAPYFLGVRAKLVKDVNRIHRSNLVNFGILPLTFVNAKDYDSIEQGDEWEISGVRGALSGDGTTLDVKLKRGAKSWTVQAKYDLSKREREVILAGGLLNYSRNANGGAPA
ncbi:MAG: aconitate hydratase [Planctomycetes bacterium]|nr:aconitate hydratase [Planctomycetota bacterium]